MKASDHLIVWAIDRPMEMKTVNELADRWRDVVGEDPRIVIFPDTKLVPMEGKGVIFEFNENFTPEQMTAFREWWKQEVGDGGS